ncbi:MAG: DHH family phosphoesterase [Candidatus Nanopelagicales bacterium]
MSIEQIADVLRGADSVLLVAHVNPDADALGSALATAIALESLGVPVRVTFPDDPFEVPPGLHFLPRQDLLVGPQIAQAAVVMSMDASSPDRIGRLLPIGQAATSFIAIDHHASFIPFAGINLCDAGQPATGMLALDLIDALGVDLTHDMAICLYAAISSDTGSFRYPATTPAAMRAAARLMDTGIDFAGIAKAMFDTKSREFIALQSAVMADLDVRTVAGYTVAIAQVPAQAREDRGIAFTEVEALIDAVRTVADVDVAVVLKQDDNGSWRVSSRSAGVADVGAVCTQVGGGGHRLAAGFTGSHDAEETLNRFLGALAA